MTKLYNVTVEENGRNVTHLELTAKEVHALCRKYKLVDVERCLYTQEDKLAQCERFGNN